MTAPSAGLIRAVAWCTAILLALLIACLCAHCAELPWAVANDFALEYRKWADMRNARVEDAARVGTLSAAELLEWQRVKSKWRTVEKSIDREYRGEQ